ncbi:putative RNA-directed DNA polymerase from transposon BS [Amphibalanus amphitrite]|uniref:Putative RNA-directed DNA polymerase from transposon BS n=1 Tax=Amphibalanus amphitrite TaxID=1232801 RepID=A0A6A4WLV9_AMPAM|nr:putative RNA-directed DNA polymerase from transposon BS [Amphibalanus amphitrite]
MEKMGIPGCATRWVKALLTDRRARVRWGNARSSQRVFQEGLPQGSVMAPLLWLIYCNDLDEDINSNTTRSLYADDTALLATGPSLQACADQLQQDLDQVARWLDKWKVEASPSKCVFTTFSLHAKEVNGKVVPTMTFKGDQLAHEKNPTFLGLTLDSQLTFTNHIEEVKKRMAQRRCCLTALAGRSYGCDQATLRAAYIAYIRSVADYGAALYSTHAAPSVRARIEAEQHKCARVITGCIRLTNSETLITEAGLPPLAVRGWEIAAMEQERLARLPPGDPARALTERHVRPRLKHRAHEAWQRARTEARRRGEPPPDPPSEDTALSFKPCFRRVSQWMAKEAGLADLPREPLALVPEQPPWTNPADAVTFRLSLPRVTRRDDPPAVRKAAALEAIAMVNPDCTIWSDGSAKSGTRDGGGGALIQLHRENREVETLVPAGSVCSSMRAELAAMLAAFTCLLAQPGETRSRIKTCLLCTDSLSGLQLLQRGPEAQQLVLAERVWAAMGSLGEQNTAIILQWVPGHADIAGNEAADRLANRAAAECAQSETPIDLASARTAIRQRAREMQATRAHRHPHPQPTPGLQDLPRWGQVTVSQLRTGHCPLARATLHRLELTPDPLCRECGAEDTVRHLLTECPAFATTRRRLWGGPLPSLDEVLSGPAGKIVEYIRRVGRSEPPLDQPPSDAPAGAST